MRFHPLPFEYLSHPGGGKPDAAFLCNPERAAGAHRGEIVDPEPMGREEIGVLDASPGSSPLCCSRARFPERLSVMRPGRISGRPELVEGGHEIVEILEVLRGGGDAFDDRTNSHGGLPVGCS
jgi:hypothetical protein